MKIRLALLTPLIFSAAIFSVVSIAPSLAASDRYALVIGNAKYPDAEAPLKEPINDARDVAEELKRDAVRRLYANVTDDAGDQDTQEGDDTVQGPHVPRPHDLPFAAVGKQAGRDRHGVG